MAIVNGGGHGYKTIPNHESEYLRVSREPVEGIVNENMRVVHFEATGEMADDKTIWEWFKPTKTKLKVKKLPGFEEKQIGGDHYKNMAITPTQYIEANNIGWSEGNVIKYISRHQNKNGRQDVEKALHYCELLLKQYDETDRLIANRK